MAPTANTNTAEAVVNLGGGPFGVNPDMICPLVGKVVIVDGVEVSVKQLPGMFQVSVIDRLRNGPAEMLHASNVKRVTFVGGFSNASPEKADWLFKATVLLELDNGGLVALVVSLEANGNAIAALPVSESVHEEWARIGTQAREGGAPSFPPPAVTDLSAG